MEIFLANKLIPLLGDCTVNLGCLIGFQTGNKLYCISASFCTDLIGGLNIVGMFYSMEANESLDNVTQSINEKLKKFNEVPSNPLILVVNKENSTADFPNTINAKIYKTADNVLINTDVSYISQIPAMLLRATGNYHIMFEEATDKDTLRKNIHLVCHKVEDIFKSNNVAFQLEDSNFYLHSKTDNTILCEHLPQFYEDDLQELIKTNMNNLEKQKPIEFRILMKCTADTIVGSQIVLHCLKRENVKCIRLKLPFDVLLICQQSTSASDIYQMFKIELIKQSRKMYEWIYLRAQSSKFITPIVYHFYPYMLTIPITAIYPSNENDEELESYRRKLHEMYLLPLDRPFLKKTNKYDFSETSHYLINPHEGLPPSGVVGGKTAIVYGKYSYHHYLQDKEDDKDWGCAYRSLQTLISWFRFQGYTNISIPTIREIQKVLVEVKDKPESFIGTKQWIGSQEVGYCLKHLLNIECKILPISQGSEMCNYGRNFYLHFKEQGTPVMIGGGNLAHTILGVDFNEKTGDLKFLILDPHYTKEENLKTIQKKGWCGWKGIEFWSSRDFYNACMPQRPIFM